jgi:hypothetical protein
MCCPDTGCTRSAGSPLLLHRHDHDPLRDVLEVLEVDTPTANVGGHARSGLGQVRSNFIHRSSRMSSLQQAPPGPRLLVSFSRVFRSDPRSMKLCQVVPGRDRHGRPVAGRSPCPDGGAATAYQPRAPSSPASRREPSNVLWPLAGNPSNRGWLVGVVRGEDSQGARRN